MFQLDTHARKKIPENLSLVRQLSSDFYSVLTFSLNIVSTFNSNTAYILYFLTIYLNIDFEFEKKICFIIHSAQIYLVALCNKISWQGKLLISPTHANSSSF